MDYNWWKGKGGGGRSNLSTFFLIVDSSLRFVCDNQATEIEQLEGLISGLEGDKLVWLGRQHNQDEQDWNMEDKIIEILQFSRKNQPEGFEKLQVHRIFSFLFIIVRF